MHRKAFVSLALMLLALPAWSTDYEAVVRNAKALADAGNLDGAIQLCESIFAARPGPPAEPQARLLMGYVLIKKKAAASEAVVQFLKAADGFPDSPEAAEALLRVGYIRDKNHEQPSEWERLVSSYPESKEAAIASHRMGGIALRAGDPELAARRFDESANNPAASQTTRDESLVQAAYACISCYWKTVDRKFLGQAITRFSELKKRQTGAKSSLMIRLGLGEAYLIYGFARQAASEYQAVVDSEPQDSFLRGLAVFELGCARYACREWEDAKRAFQTFLDSQVGETLKDKDASWKAARPGYSELAAADPDKAAALSALDVVPAAVYWQAATLSELRQFREAKQKVEQVQAAFPGVGLSSRAERLRGMCCDALGEAR